MSVSFIILVSPLIFLNYLTINSNHVYFVEMVVSEAVGHWLVTMKHGLGEISLHFFFFFTLQCLFCFYELIQLCSKYFSLYSLAKGHFANVLFAKQFAERINLIYFHLYFFSDDLASHEGLKETQGECQS